MEIACDRGVSLVYAAENSLYKKEIRVKKKQLELHNEERNKHWTFKGYIYSNGRGFPTTAINKVF